MVDLNLREGSYQMPRRIASQNRLRVWQYILMDRDLPEEADRPIGDRFVDHLADHVGTDYNFIEEKVNGGGPRQFSAWFVVLYTQEAVTKLVMSFERTLDEVRFYTPKELLLIKADKPPKPRSKIWA
jgi:hypothetical protein